MAFPTGSDDSFVTFGGTRKHRCNRTRIVEQKVPAVYKAVGVTRGGNSVTRPVSVKSDFAADLDSNLCMSSQASEGASVRARACRSLVALLRGPLVGPGERLRECPPGCCTTEWTRSYRLAPGSARLDRSFDPRCVQVLRELRVTARKACDTNRGASSFANSRMTYARMSRAGLC